jgi:hypothetical protein
MHLLIDAIAVTKPPLYCFVKVLGSVKQEDLHNVGRLGLSKPEAASGARVDKGKADARVATSSSKLGTT